MRYISRFPSHRKHFKLSQSVCPSCWTSCVRDSVTARRNSPLLTILVKKSLQWLVQLDGHLKLVQLDGHWPPIIQLSSSSLEIAGFLAEMQPHVIDDIFPVQIPRTTFTHSYHPSHHAPAPAPCICTFYQARAPSPYTLHLHQASCTLHLCLIGSPPRIPTAHQIINFRTLKRYIYAYLLGLSFELSK